MTDLPPDDENIEDADKAISEVERMLLSPAEKVKDTKRRLPAPERRQKVFDLKMRGKTLEQIAAELNINYNTAQADFAYVTRSIDVTKWLRSRIDGDVLFLDKIISAITPRALAGELEAIEVILKIMARQHKILGMEAPKKVDIRVLVQQWAEREGLDPGDAIAVVSGLIGESTGV